MDIQPLGKFMFDSYTACIIIFVPLHNSSNPSTPFRFVEFEYSVTNSTKRNGIEGLLELLLSTAYHHWCLILHAVYPTVTSSFVLQVDSGVESQFVLIAKLSCSWVCLFLLFCSLYYMGEVNTRHYTLLHGFCFYSCFV